MTVTATRIDLAATRNGVEPVLTIDNFAPPGSMRSLPLDQIKANGNTQMRAGLDHATVEEYRDALSDNPGVWPFPPVVVFFDGATYWLADGFHRVAAATGVRAGVPADIRSGSQRDAILFAAGANASHGLRRTGADKRRAMETLLRDEEWGQWSNTEIARRCQVSEGTVRTLRGILERTSQITKSATRKSADGRTINVGNIGAKPKRYLDVPAIVTTLTPVLADTPADTVYAGAAGRNSNVYAACVRALHPAEARQADIYKALYQIAAARGVGAMPTLQVNGSRPLPNWVSAQEPDAEPADDDIDDHGNVVASSATGSRQQGSPLAKCSVCSRPLYDPVQAAQGIGACCAAKKAAGALGGDGAAEQPATTPPPPPTAPTWVDANPNWVNRDGLLPDGRIATVDFRIFTLKLMRNTFELALKDLGAWAEQTGHFIATLEAERGLKHVIELNERELQSLGGA